MVEKNRKLLALGAIAVAGALVAGTASAQNWPNRAIRIINPFPAGGGTDAFARPLAAVMPKDLGQQVQIENLGGAGGTLGAGTASRAPGDGYTWFMGAVHHTIAETLYRKLSYSLTKDFVPVTLAASVPSAVVVHPSVPAKTIKELIALDKRSPGAINYGSAGYGTTHHMNGELFNLITGTKLTHVPYKGAGPLTPALLSGEVAMAFDGMGTAGPNVKSGRARTCGHHRDALRAAARSADAAGVRRQHQRHHLVCAVGHPRHSATDRRPHVPVNGKSAADA